MLNRKPIYNVIGFILIVVLVIELVMLWNKFHPKTDPPANMVCAVQVC